MLTHTHAHEIARRKNKTKIIDIFSIHINRKIFETIDFNYEIFDLFVSVEISKKEVIKK